MKGTMKRIATFALAVMMVLSVVMVQSPIEANAASTKKVTANYNYKKAPALKTGTNKVTAKKKGYNYPFVKFKAPKAGTYTFAISGITSTGNTKKEIGYGNISLGVPSGYKNYMTDLKVQTNKAKNASKIGTKKVYASSLGICTSYCWNKYEKADYKKGKSNYVYTRYLKIKLKKGQTVYLNSYFAGTKTKYTYTVNIKRK